VLWLQPLKLNKTRRKKNAKQAATNNFCCLIARIFDFTYIYKRFLCFFFLIVLFVGHFCVILDFGFSALVILFSDFLATYI